MKETTEGREKICQDLSDTKVSKQKTWGHASEVELQWLLMRDVAFAAELQK